MNQHKKPCSECPFNWRCESGLLGGASPDVYCGQINLAFWLPCHCSKNYQGKASDVNEVSQCAGAAIFRANVHKMLRHPEALRLPRDEKTCFASDQEFREHHTK